MDAARLVSLTFCNETWVFEMTHSRCRRGIAALAAILASLIGAGTAAAQTAASRMTLDLIANQSSLTAGLPDGKALNLRAAWDMPSGNVLQAELLEERKFGQSGGVAAVAFTQPFDEAWYAIGSLALGHGGPNWANQKLELQLSHKWLAQRQLVTSLALYEAHFDAARNDRGSRLSITLYGSTPALVEAGVILNRSQPGRVRSTMPYASAVFGQHGTQLISLRASSGREAYQALGTLGGGLVDFHSRSLSANWRRWLAPGWGLSAQIELYRNPAYQRHTLGGGLFAQW